MLERLRGVAGVGAAGGRAAAPEVGAAGRCRRGQAWLRWRNRWPAGELAGVAAGLARAVAGMHARGVMHRDITPANVVLSGGGVCLVDFALALSHGGDPAGLRAVCGDRRDASVSGAGVHRVDRPAGGSAGRPVRAGRGAV